MKVRPEKSPYVTTALDLGTFPRKKMVLGPFILLYSDLETIKCTVEEKVGWEIAETSKIR